MSFGHWPHDRDGVTPASRSSPGVLEQFTSERLSITGYHEADLDALAYDGRHPRDESL